MTCWPALALIALLGAAATGQAMSGGGNGGGGGAATLTAIPAPLPGIANPARAHQHWILQCQGCHRADATGTPATTPAMAGIIGKFLSVPGGREYLGRVPGVATAALPDADLAELLNWTLRRFDAAHVPADFKPYTAEEIGKLRHRPLRVDAAQERARLAANFTDEEAMPSKK